MLPCSASGQPCSGSVIPQRDVCSIVTLPAADVFRTDITDRAAGVVLAGPAGQRRDVAKRLVSHYILSNRYRTDVRAIYVRFSPCQRPPRRCLARADVVAPESALKGSR